MSQECGEHLFSKTLFFFCALFRCRHTGFRVPYQPVGIPAGETAAQILRSFLHKFDERLGALRLDELLLDGYHDLRVCPFHDVRHAVLLKVGKMLLMFIESFPTKDIGLEFLQLRAYVKIDNEPSVSFRGESPDTVREFSLALDGSPILCSQPSGNGCWLRLMIHFDFLLFVLFRPKAIYVLFNKHLSGKLAGKSRMVDGGWWM